MKLSDEDLQSLLNDAQTAAVLAGDIISSYAGKNIEVLSKKGGNSEASQVLTEVDLRCETLILERLKESAEKFDLAILSEEQEDNKARLSKEAFWCVDPLDGTLAFSESKPGYAVSIALVSSCGEPLLGVIYDPLRDILYTAIKGLGARRNGQAWEPLTETPSYKLTVPCDRSLIKREDFSSRISALRTWAQKRGLAGLEEKHHAGAVLNACMALEDLPGCYFKPPKPQEGGGSLWDFAATACLYKEVGAYVSDFFGDDLDLNRPDTTFMNEKGVIFSTDRELGQFIQSLRFETSQYDRT